MAASSSSLLEDSKQAVSKPHPWAGVDNNKAISQSSSRVSDLNKQHKQVAANSSILLEDNKQAVWPL